MSFYLKLIIRMVCAVNGQLPYSSMCILPKSFCFLTKSPIDTAWDEVDFVSKSTYRLQCGRAKTFCEGPKSFSECQCGRAFSSFMGARSLISSTVNNTKYLDPYHRNHISFSYLFLRQ